MAKIKAGFKGAVFFFVILVLIAGTVCAVVFWPKRPEEIKGLVNEQVAEVFGDDSEFIVDFENFGEYSSGYRASNASAKKSYNSVSNIIVGLDVYFNYVSYVFQDADFGMYNQQDISKAREHLVNAKGKMDEVSAFLKQSNANLTIPDGDSRKYEIQDAELVWNNIQDDLKGAMDCYYNATYHLAEIYDANVTKGVYANNFAKITINGVHHYIDYFNENFSQNATLSFNEMSKYFKTFVTKYLSNTDGQSLTGSYLTSPELRSYATKLYNFDSQVATYSLKQLVLDELTYDTESYTGAQKTLLNLAVSFYKGGFTA